MTKAISALPHSDSADIEAIHEGTALYTNAPEIEDLLDRINWPHCGGRLLDPGCGNGNMVIAALERLVCKPGDFEDIQRVTGFEFHHDSVIEARLRCRDLLVSKGWGKEAAENAADALIEERDFLLESDSRQWDVILSNPPYWRRFRLPEKYLARFDEVVAPHARGDLLHAFLDRIMTVLRKDGVAALITSDRWISNATAGKLREGLGAQSIILHCERLASESPFHRPKTRRKSSPPRVHAIAMVLRKSTGPGQRLHAGAHIIESMPPVDGIRFAELVDIRLAPWLGPDGIFLLETPDAVPGARTVPCVMPKGIDPETGQIKPVTRWAIVTGEERPAQAVLDHLARNMGAMPKRGIRPVLWHPPERFDQHLPLNHEAVLIPRIAKSLRPIIIPAGYLPINHSLVIASGLPASDIAAMLLHPMVQQQANILAQRVESGYRSYTASLLRELIIPYDAIESQRRAA